MVYKVLKEIEENELKNLMLLVDASWLLGKFLQISIYS